MWQSIPDYIHNWGQQYFIPTVYNIGKALLLTQRAHLFFILLKKNCTKSGKSTQVGGEIWIAKLCNQWVLPGCHAEHTMVYKYGCHELQHPASSHTLTCWCSPDFFLSTPGFSHPYTLFNWVFFFSFCLGQLFVFWICDFCYLPSIIKALPSAAAVFATLHLA